jgi:peptidoglycan hydrolase CwlO-like protein
MTILGSNILTSVASYIAGKKRSNAETDNLILANLERAIDVYSKIIDNLKIEITELHSKIDEMEKKIDELHDENKKLKKLLNNAAAN